LFESSSRTQVLSDGEKNRIYLIYLCITIAILLGVAASLFVGGVSIALGGLGIVAFVFGLRHGVDADHLAAIDNLTRKLVQEGKSPLTVGTWFSLGHSTVVFSMIVGLVIATKSIVQALPFLQVAGALLGTTISGLLLWLMGLMNLTIAVGLYKAFRGLKDGALSQPDLEELLGRRGMINRYFRSLFRIVSEPWKAYPVGLLFGLGFDTASEIALIAITVGVSVTGSVPLWMVLLLPFMFTCGMVLVDTTDGVGMRMAYAWAVLKPLRKVYYNLTVTIISVLVAFAVGTVELLQVAGGELNARGPLWSFLGTLDFETLGLLVIGVFGATWLASFANWKYKRYNELIALDPTAA
jgi:nickel/cobalt transporter (NiCoT) family protein